MENLGRPENEASCDSCKSCKAEVIVYARDLLSRCAVVWLWTQLLVACGPQLLVACGPQLLVACGPQLLVACGPVSLEEVGWLCARLGTRQQQAKPTTRTWM